MQSLITVVVGGIIVNYLLQRWQSRSWLQQQRLMGQQKKYADMFVLFSDISDCAGRRCAQMFRLADSLNFDDIERVKQRLDMYDTALKDWNEKLNGLYVR